MKAETIRSATAGLLLALAAGGPANGQSADLSVTQLASPNPVLVSNVLTYTVTVANAGPNDATSARLTNTVSALLTNLTAAPSQGSYSISGRVVTCQFGTIAAGATAAVTIAAMPFRNGIATNVARATTATADPVPGNNVTTNLAVVRALPTVALPYASHAATNGSGYVTISNLVRQADGGTCQVELAYSTDDGVNWGSVWVQSATSAPAGITVAAPPDAVPQVMGIVTTNGSGVKITNRVTAVWSTTNAPAWIDLCTNTRVRARAWDGLNWSDWSTSAAFRVDNQAPGLPASLTSTSHTTWAYRSSRLIGMVWDRAPDGAGSGIRGYGYTFTNLPGYVLPATFRLSGTNVASTALPNGTNWWFFLRVGDSNGNWGAATSVGPFWIDGSLPLAPPGLDSDKADTGKWTNNVDHLFRWGMPTGQLSGIVGYSIGQDGPPDSVIDTTATQATWLAAADGKRTYQVKALSGAGLWGLTNVFNLWVDTAPPVTSNDISLAWYTNSPTFHVAVTDLLSGFQQCYYKINATAVRTGTNMLINTNGANIVVDYWCQDKAGNLTPTTTVSGIRVDTVGPVYSNWRRFPSDLAWNTPAGAVRVIVDVSDAVSGLGASIPEIDFRIGGSTNTYDGIYEPMSWEEGLGWWFELTADWSALAGSNLAYRVRATDVAGKASVSAEQVEYIDPPSGLVVAEGERFSVLDTNGWALTQMDDSYGCANFGGMWPTYGAVLGAPPESSNSVAVQDVTIERAGVYRVWSKYQSPPYFNFLHRLDVLQNGTSVYSYVYGRTNSWRLWSYSVASDELWWSWGPDHDAAEAPSNLFAALESGPARIRLETVPNEEPAADRFVDFVVLTTNLTDYYDGYNASNMGLRKVSTPFYTEALNQTKLYMRYRNGSPTPQKLKITRPIGHVNPTYSGITTNMPANAPAAGAWSEWFNIGPFCRLVCNEGLALSLTGATADIDVEFARDSAGLASAGSMSVPTGMVVNIPLTIGWDTTAVVRTSADLARELIAAARGPEWRHANGGRKPQQIPFYGRFNPMVGTNLVDQLKDAMGYNTLLPDTYDHMYRDGYYTHAGTATAISNVAKTLTAEQKQRFRVLSNGDEIALGSVSYADPAVQAAYRQWLVAREVPEADLGEPPESATLTKTGTPRQCWWSNLFNEDTVFGKYRDLTQIAKNEIGPHVLYGANYSPHHLALYYGGIGQWVDLFRTNGFNLYWTEDYIFLVPEAPQIVSWMLATTRCAVRYNGQPVHFYVMPHSPGQLPEHYRRSLVTAIGNGAAHIDSFCVAPQENFTENYIAWNYSNMFRAVTEGTYDTAEAESFQAGGALRPARVAIVLSKATDYNEGLVMVPKAQDAFLSRCANAPATVNQIICRKDQQMLYLTLRQAGHAVDLITEGDIVSGVLSNAGYQAVYFAGEWIDDHAVPALGAWVQGGGQLYACAGAGLKNQYREPSAGMEQILGVSTGSVSRNLAVVRTLMELPLAPPIGTITFQGQPVSAIGLRQQLVPGTAQVLGTWDDGSAAVTMNAYGAGRAYAVGTLAGNTCMRTGLRDAPYARGGRKTVYNPCGFSAPSAALVGLAADAAAIDEPVACSNPQVEWSVMDNPTGTLVSLVNWSNARQTNLQVRVSLPVAPSDVRSVEQQQSLPASFAHGVLTFSIDLAEADYILIPRAKGLVVSTPVGTAEPPAGTNELAYGAVVTCAMVDSPVTDGLTQYVCRGWSGAGSISATGAGTNTGPLTITNDSSIAWQWDAGYWLGVGTAPGGTVSGGTSGWYSAGATVTMTATPGEGSVFGGWSGDLPPAQVYENPITLTMDRARQVSARFGSPQKSLLIQLADRGHPF